MKDWIDLLVEERVREEEFDLDDTFRSPLPRLYPGATPDEIDELERSMGVPMEPFYRYFLSRTDGMDNFHVDISMLGCRDWRERSPRLAGAERYGSTVLSVLYMDVGLPEDVVLAPIAVAEDWTTAIFAFHLEGVPERYWWVGQGESLFYPDLRHIFDHSTRFMDYLRDYTPRSSLEE